MHVMDHIPDDKLATPQMRGCLLACACVLRHHCVGLQVLMHSQYLECGRPTVDKLRAVSLQMFAHASGGV